MGGQSETWSHGESDFSADSDALPAMIGRYQVRKLLGRGAFGRVFLAFDEQLGRQVAIKVPHRALTPNPDRAQAYLACLGIGQAPHGVHSCDERASSRPGLVSARASGQPEHRRPVSSRGRQIRQMVLPAMRTPHCLQFDPFQR